VQPGGSSRAIEAAEALRLRARVRELRAFLERELLGDTLEAFLSLRTEAELNAWAAERGGGATTAPDAPVSAATPDLPLWLRMAADTGLHTLGQGPGLHLATGSFPGLGSEGPALPAGVWQDGAVAPLSADTLAGITEDAHAAWLNAGETAPRHPAQGVTQPAADKPGAYTWNKAPRLQGRTAECGALSRQRVAGQPLVTDACARVGATVYTRVLARLVELCAIVTWMDAGLGRLKPGAPYQDGTRDGEAPASATGVGLVEAARGSLGHWLRIERGRIAHYQIIAPTSWNFSPRDSAGEPGPLEAALVGAPVAEGERTPVSVQHIVRSFDPCMVCTVH
jgi:hydrogenase large subunit